MSVSIFYFVDDPEVLSVFLDAFGDQYDVRTASTLEEVRRGKLRPLRDYLPDTR